MEKNILIIGAGKLGKGFIGEAFNKAKWQVTFLDKDPRVIENLAKGSYQVNISTSKEVYSRVINNYQQILTSNEHKEANSFLSTDLVMIPEYPEDLYSVFKYLIYDFEKMKMQYPDKKLDIVLLTNKVHLVKKIEQYLKESLDTNLYDWMQSHIFIRDAIIRRSTDAKTNYSLNLDSMAVASLLIETPLHVSLDQVDWMEPCENVPTLKEVKIYAINGPHATTAFFGKYKHYKTIPEAQQNQDILYLVDKVTQQIYAACMKEFSLSSEEIDRLVKLPTLKQEVPDSIKRVAYDPLRKLSNNDRLCGPIKLCEKYGLNHDGLDKAVALGLKYYDKDDPKSIEMQNLIKEKGIFSAIKEITGLDDKCAQSILAQYKKL